MKALLDTNVLLWVAISPALLSESARAVLEDDRNILFISAASAWEIATKVRLGKLPEAVMFERDFVASAQAAGYSLLPISVEAALRSGRLLGANRDPFDRMIAAQALELDIEVISNDIQLDGFGVRRIW